MAAMIVQSLFLMLQVANVAAIDIDRSVREENERLNMAVEMHNRGHMKVDKHRQHQRRQLTRSEGGFVRTEAESSAMKGLYPFYHTTDEIKKEAARLSKNCGGMMNISTLQDGDVALDLISVRKANTKPLNKVFILFGEHARELISPESGLHFLKGLCGEIKLNSLLQGADETNDILEKNEFQMVLNANPRSRMKVEDGDFCLRTNPDGVDLNRNWDEEWQGTAATFGGDSNPGSKPFSEPETRILKKVVTDFAPQTFLTVHSGTRGMYMPWAYDMEHLAKKNEPSMMEILKKLDKDHCECPFGAAGKEVGYPCPGTCLDYAYGKLDTPYVFAFEIYVSHMQDSDLKERWSRKMREGGDALIEKGNHLAHPHFRDVFSEHSSDFVHLAPATSPSFLEAKSQSSLACFNTFNPSDEDEYKKVIQNWADVYIQMSQLVAQKIEAGEDAANTVS